MSTYWAFEEEEEGGEDGQLRHVGEEEETGEDERVIRLWKIRKGCGRINMKKTDMTYLSLSMVSLNNLHFLGTMAM